MYIFLNTNRGTTYTPHERASTIKSIIQYTSTQVYVTVSYVSLVVDSDQAGTLKWMSGQTLSSSNYTNWSPHYPQKHPNQTDCGKVEAGKTAVLSLYITKYCKYYI